MNIKKIALDVIEVGTRLRTLNPIYVAEIALSFELKGGEGRGQITPIEVREAGDDGRFRLISGAHRLAAAQASGWRTISASVFKGTNGEAELREIDENLVRHDLSDLDRAAFLAKREEIWVQLHPDTQQGRAGAVARWHGNRNLRFASDAAEKLGVSEDTIERLLDLARVTSCFTGELRARISASYLANRKSELRALATAVDDDERRRAIDLLLSEDKAAPKKVDAALRIVRGTPEEHRPKDGKDFDAFTSLWAKCSAETRANIGAYVAGELASASARSKRKP